jgi:hypothetical protein
MKDILAFAGEHPVLFTFILLAICSVVNTLTFRPFNRWIRSRNIASKGWPPPHLDADGDFKEDDK